MTELYRSVPINDGDLFEVQFNNNSMWKTMYRNGVPLQFKIEKMAEMQVALFEIAAIHKIPVVNSSPLL